MITDDAVNTTETPENALPDPPATGVEAAGVEPPVPPRAPAKAAEPGGTGPESEPNEPAAPSNKHWYVVKVQSGREESIKDAIERKVKIEGLEEYFGQIYIPVEKVTEMRNNKRHTRERKKLPGYNMAEEEFNDRSLYLFRETSGVGDFVGGSVTRPPTPMSPREVQQWSGLPKGPGSKEEPVELPPEFETGDRVRVKDGTFKDMEGEVKDVL